MGAREWILTLILGGILGMIGQGIRVVIGLKKMNEQASQEGKKFGDLFQGSALSLSLLIGFIAGALAMIGVTGDIEVKTFSRELIVTILVAGYAGTDFIEGFIKKRLPAGGPGMQVSAKIDEIELPAVG